MSYAIYLDINLPQSMGSSLICRLSLGRFAEYEMAKMFLDECWKGEQYIPKLGRKVLKAIEKDLGQKLSRNLRLAYES